MRGSQALAYVLREAEHFIAIRTHPDGNEDVQSSASRSLGEGDEIEFVQGALEQQPGLGGVGKFAGARIQVEYYPIRLARILRAALPHVYGNASQVHQRELRF